MEHHSFANCMRAAASVQQASQQWDIVKWGVA